MKSKSLVEQLKEGWAVKPEGGAPMKRFTWSAPIVSPQANKKHDFQSVAPKAAPLAVSGTIAPINLREARSKVAKARAAKQKGYAK